MLGLALALGLASNPWAQPRVAVFGGGPRWTLVNVHTLAARQLLLPDGFHAKRLVSTASGKLVVFSGTRVLSEPNGLFVWRPDESAGPVALLPAGKHAGDVALNSTAEWVYFVSNSSGPPGQHAAKDYAQVFRISPDGGTPEQLTSGPGCHMLPGFAGKRLFYLHTACNGFRWVEWLAAGAKEPVRLDGEAVFLDLAISPDGNSVLTDVNTSGETSVFRGDLGVGRLVPLFRFQSVTTSAWVQFGKSATDVLYQEAGRVWLKSGSADAKAIIDLATGKGF